MGTEKQQPLLDFVAGTIAGCVGICIAQPFDTMKVLLQSHLASQYSRNMFKALRTVVQEEGVLGLYKGMISPLLGNSIISCILFGVEGNLARYYMKKKGITDKHLLPIRDVCKSGCISGFVQTFIASPTEYIKIQMQIQHLGKKVYNSNWDCVKAVVRTNGVRGLFSGLTSNLLRDVPTFGLYFGAFELLQNVFKRINPNASEFSKAFTTFLSGGVGGSVCWISAYPWDVLKTRIQSQTIGKPPIYRNTWDCFKQIYRTEGINAFSKGLTACVIRAFPLNGVTFLAYELLMKMFSKTEKPKSII